MRTLITGGTVVREDGVFDAEVLLDAGRILEIGERLHETSAGRGADEIVAVTGCFILPGGVDVHTHVNLTAGETHVADGFTAATEAAAFGGTTTLVEHPGFGASDCDLMQQIDTYTAEAAGRCAVDYAFHGVLQRVDAGILAQIPELVRQGIPTFKAYTTYDGRLNDEELLCALSAVEEAGGLLTVHAENHAMIRFLTAHLAATDARSDPASYPKSRPAACEAEAVYRLLHLARIAEASLYIVHLSTAAGLEHVRRAQAEQRKQARQDATRKVMAETCPHYLVLNETRYAEPDGRTCIMAPPLRTAADCDALWEGLADGSLSVVATDHCSFSLAQKEHADTVFQCPSGIPGVET
ncbi:MAG: amidohydrolase family protein, partial [Bilophila sp.]